MDGALQLIDLDEAAFMLGVESEELRQKLDAGQIPEAVQNRNDWRVPSHSLSHIASRNGWSFNEQSADLEIDLRSSKPRYRQAVEPKRAGDEARAIASKYVSETASAHAAVVLAKAQAAAARSESSDLARKLKMARLDLEAEQAEKARAIAQLAETEKSLNQVSREKAVLDAKLEASERAVQSEQERTRLSEAGKERIESERARVYASLGWLGRHRLRRSSL